MIVQWICENFYDKILLKSNFTQKMKLKKNILNSKHLGTNTTKLISICEVEVVGFFIRDYTKLIIKILVLITKTKLNSTRVNG